jgi:hypothetical protein
MLLEGKQDIQEENNRQFSRVQATRAARWCIHPLPVNHHPAIWVCQLLVPQTRDRSNAIHRQLVPVVAELESVLYPLSVIVKKVRTHSCKCSQCKLFIFCRPLWSVAQRLIDGIGIDFNVYGGNAADCQLLGMACNPLSVMVGFASIIQHQQARKNKGVLAPHLHGDFRAKALYNLYRAIQEKRSQILDNMADSQTDASATTTEEAKKEDDEEDFMALDRRNDGEKVESTGASVDAVKDEAHCGSIKGFPTSTILRVTCLLPPTSIPIKSVPSVLLLWFDGKLSNRKTDATFRMRVLLYKNSEFIKNSKITIAKQLKKGS